MVDRIAQTLCAARRADPLGPCPYCDRGRCQPVMWRNFRPEAAAVWAMLQREVVVVSSGPKRLPELGGLIAEL